MPDAPPLAPADRAIVEAAFIGMLRAGLGKPPEDFGARIKWGMAMGRSALAAALPLVAGICMHLGPNHCACNSREPDCARCIALKAAADEINALAARLAEAGNE